MSLDIIEPSPLCPKAAASAEHQEGVLCFQTVLYLSECMYVRMSGFLLILNKTANYGQISNFKVSMEASR